MSVMPRLIQQSMQSSRAREQKKGVWEAMEGLVPSRAKSREHDKGAKEKGSKAKLKCWLPNVRPSDAVCKLRLANVHKLVRELKCCLPNCRPSAAVCKLNFACCPALLLCCPALLPCSVLPCPTPPACPAALPCFHALLPCLVALLGARPFLPCSRARQPVSCPLLPCPAAWHALMSCCMSLDTRDTC